MAIIIQESNPTRHGLLWMVLLGTMFAMSTLWILAFIAVTFLTGVYLLIRGLSTPRRGNAPHCSHCNYNLTGLSSDHCPECGTPILPDSVVYGERHRRPAKILLGIVCLFPTLLLLAILFSSFNWYPWVPTAWVMSDCTSTNSMIATRAWTELDRRILAGTLTAEQKKALVDFVGLALDVRPRVVQGHNVPYRWRIIGTSPKGSSSVVDMFLSTGDCIVDGKLAKEGGGVFGSGMSLSPSGTGSFASSFKYEQLGKHELQITNTLKISASSINTLLYQTDVSRKAAFEILPADTVDDIKMIHDSSIAAQMQACIRPGGFELGRNWHTGKNGRRIPMLSGGIEIKAPPVSAAFDVIARVNDKEYRAGRVYMAKGQSISWGTEGEYSGPPAEKMDIILRSSKEAARDTVDLFEIWDGELVYKDVPVKVIAPATTSAPS